MMPLSTSSQRFLISEVLSSLRHRADRSQDALRRGRLVASRVSRAHQHLSLAEHLFPPLSDEFCVNAVCAGSIDEKGAAGIQEFIPVIVADGHERKCSPAHQEGADTWGPYSSSSRHKIARTRLRKKRWG